MPFTVGPEHYARLDWNTPAHLPRLAALNRINALSCIKSAEHGWLGASFSVAELLTTLYFQFREDGLVLSKGHAAAMQYACLHGLGRIDRSQLLSYKNGPIGVQAHTDRSTPGILLNTGSLGQALSKVAGIAFATPERRFAVILGDGELQEGQVFEAVQPLVRFRLANLTTFVDLNGFQSKQRVEDVKPIANLRKVFEGFGLDVLEIDGHDTSAVAEAWRAARDRPTVVLARTVKAGGSAFLAPETATQPWHGKVPDDDLYARIVEEQVAKADLPEVASELERWRTGWPPSRPGKRPSPSVVSTRDAFAGRLGRMLDERPELFVLDGDLAGACGLEPLSTHPRFLEMGISEQDMVSFAGGLALSGKLPVVNTFAAFYKRAIEQLFVNATEGAKVIYAGHYAGLCYHTDGKTHQSLTDLGLMLSLPGLAVVEPATPRQTELFLDWAAGPQPASVYLRLRRTPMPLELPEEGLAVDRPLILGDRKRLFVTMGTVSTRLALDCLRRPEFQGWGLLVQSVLRGPMDLDFYRDCLRAAEQIVTIEEDLRPGSLAAVVRELLAEFELNPGTTSVAIDALGASFRSLDGCLEHFRFTAEALASKLARQLSNQGVDPTQSHGPLCAGARLSSMAPFRGRQGGA